MSAHPDATTLAAAEPISGRGPSEWRLRAPPRAAGERALRSLHVRRVTILPVARGNVDAHRPACHLDLRPIGNARAAHLDAENPTGLATHRARESTSAIVLVAAGHRDRTPLSVGGTSTGSPWSALLAPGEFTVNNQASLRLSATSRRLLPGRWGRAVASILLGRMRLAGPQVQQLEQLSVPTLWSLAELALRRS
jgi:hypothetical protein